MIAALGLPPARHVEDARRALDIADEVLREVRHDLAADRCREAVAALRVAAIAAGNAESHVESLPFDVRRRRLSHDLQRRFDQLRQAERRLARRCVVERGRP